MTVKIKPTASPAPDRVATDDEARCALLDTYGCTLMLCRTSRVLRANQFDDAPARLDTEEMEFLLALEIAERDLN